MLAALSAHVEAMALEGQVKDWTPEQRQLVFPNKAGRVMQYSTFLEDVWQPLLAKAGLPYRKYHSTRHSFATWLLELGLTFGGCRTNSVMRRSRRQPTRTATRNLTAMRSQSMAWISTSRHDATADD